MLALAASALPIQTKLAMAQEMPPVMHGAMPQRVLGKTGEKVSMIGLGGYHIGVPDEPEGIRVIHTAIDNGINFMDNCWDYHNGGSEERMGRALRGGYRDRVFLMTKIDGRNKATAARQIDESLKRLQTDRIDLMQIHEVIRISDPEVCFAAGGTIEALVDAKKAGKIRYIGFTGHKSPEIHLKMLAAAEEHGFEFDTVQMPLNPMDWHFRSFEREVLPKLVSKNIGVLGMKPLGGGALLKSRVVTAPECLTYALSLPTSVVITGCESMRDLEQALTIGLNFSPLDETQRHDILKKTIAASVNGPYEWYKTDDRFDGTTHHPEWMG